MDLAQIRAVSGEMANMICGSVLSRLESDTTFDLEVPVHLDGPAPAADHAVSKKFLVEDDTVEVALEFHA